MLFPDMSTWRVRIDGLFVHLLHEADEDGPLWSGAVEIVRGAPGADSHPELRHAFMALDVPGPHQAFIRHTWTYEIPENYRGLSNLGDDRRYLILQATGAEVNWTLDLKLPHATPRFAYKAICRAFNATPKENPCSPKDPMPSPSPPLSRKAPSRPRRSPRRPRRKRASTPSSTKSKRS